MRRRLLAAIASAAIVSGPAALAETVNEHRVFAPADIKWGSAPPALPGGAESAVLYGDPAKEGMFALRIKMPKGYNIPAHTHPKPEIITVISGIFGLGMGTKADRSKTDFLPAGSFSSMPQGMAHYVFADKETIVQINAIGPWRIDYVDPREDPRLNIAPSEQKSRQRD